MAERIKRVKERSPWYCLNLGRYLHRTESCDPQEMGPFLFTFTNSSSKNYGGIVGAYISDALLMIIGVSAFAIPLFILVYGVKAAQKKKATGYTW